MAKRKPSPNKGKTSPNEPKPGQPYNRARPDDDPPVYTQGRRPIIEDPDEAIRTIRALAQIKCTKREIASVLNVSEPTLYRFFSRYPQAEEAYEDGLEMATVSLRRNQYKLSERSASMAMFLGVQELGQKPLAAYKDNQTPDLGNGIMRALLQEVDSRMRQADEIRAMKTIEHKP